MISKPSHATPIIMMICKTLSSNFSSSRHDREKLNTDSESALKSALENGLKCVNKYFWDRQKCLPNIFEDTFQSSF